MVARLLIFDICTEPWGVQVVGVETKDVGLPDAMKRAMARQAEAERERRAKIIAAQGEFQAAERLAEAVEVMSAQPDALTLRTLQTLAEVATEHNSTLVLPVPLDVLRLVRPDGSGPGPGPAHFSFPPAERTSP